MNNLIIQKISNDLAKNIIVKNHYTHKWTICELALGLYIEKSKERFDFPELVGVIVFGPTAGANVSKSVSPLLEKNQLWELKRLWIDDKCIKNTESWFISQSINYIKNNCKQIKCLISYADPDAGHIGTIYQASNWIYQNIERPPKTSGYVVSFNNGKTWQHGRTLFNKYGTFEFNKLVDQLPRPFLIKELSTKERYIYPLVKHSEKRKLMNSLNHKPLPYPKINKDSMNIMEYK